MHGHCEKKECSCDSKRSVEICKDCRRHDFGIVRTKTNFVFSGFFHESVIHFLGTNFYIILRGGPPVKNDENSIFYQKIYLVMKLFLFILQTSKKYVFFQIC